MGRIRVYVKLKASGAGVAHEQLLDMLDKAGIALSLTTHKPDAEELPDGAWLITLHPRRMSRVLDEETSFASFEGADALYAWLQRRKTKVSIVTDTFSRARVDTLRPLIRDIEEEFRVMLLKQGIVLDEIDKQHQRRSGDHGFSMLETYRLLHGYFFSPADDAHYLEELAKATTDEARLAARNLTRLDQLGYGEHADTLKEFSDIRNIVAHNRVLPDEQFMRNYLGLRELKRAIRTRQFMQAFKASAAQMQSFAESMRIIQEQVTTLGQAMAKAYSPIMQVADAVAAIMPKLNPAIEAQLADAQQLAKALTRLAPTPIVLPTLNLPFPPTSPTKESEKPPVGDNK